MRILLVDDEYELVSTLAERMVLRGYDTDWATSGEDALEKIRTQAYDVVVIDVKMPKMSGIELKDRMQEARPGMKYIFITGHGSRSDFMNVPAETRDQFYLLKPVGIELLIRKIHEAVADEGEAP